MDTKVPRFNLEKDFVDLLSAFHAHGARYLLVGGYAVGAYSEPRATNDIDLFVLTTKENSERVYQALAAFGAPLAGLTPNDFEEKTTYFQMGAPPLRVDVLKTLSGIEFAEAWESRVRGIANETTEVWVISSPMLIRNKRATGRLKDLADVEAIERCERLTRGDRS